MAFFWSVYFPFNYQYYKIAGKMKYIHVMFLALGIFLPLIPVIAILVGNFAQERNSGSNTTFWSGFQPDTFSNTICMASNKEVSFYSFTIPACVMATLGLTLLILIIHFFIKVSLNINLVS